VRASEAKSHYGRGWELFTDRVVQILCERETPIAFLLWGKSALDKFHHIGSSQTTPHLVLTAAHPSPLSAYAGFFECRHFSKVNEFLVSTGRNPIDWKII
jgi:uracil-DNA glycosylase